MKNGEHIFCLENLNSLMYLDAQERKDILSFDGLINAKIISEDYYNPIYNMNDLHGVINDFDVMKKIPSDFTTPKKNISHSTKIFFVKNPNGEFVHNSIRGDYYHRLAKIDLVFRDKHSFENSDNYPVTDEEFKVIEIAEKLVNIIDFVSEDNDYSKVRGLNISLGATDDTLEEHKANSNKRHYMNKKERNNAINRLYDHVFSKVDKNTHNYTIRKDSNYSLDELRTETLILLSSMPTLPHLVRPIIDNNKEKEYFESLEIIKNRVKELTRERGFTTNSVVINYIIFMIFPEYSSNNRVLREGDVTWLKEVENCDKFFSTIEKFSKEISHDYRYLTKEVMSNDSLKNFYLENSKKEKEEENNCNHIIAYNIWVENYIDHSQTILRIVEKHNLYPSREVVKFLWSMNLENLLPYDVNNPYYDKNSKDFNYKDNYGNFYNKGWTKNSFIDGELVTPDKEKFKPVNYDLLNGIIIDHINDDFNEEGQEYAVNLMNIVLTHALSYFNNGISTNAINELNDYYYKSYDYYTYVFSLLALIKNLDNDKINGLLSIITQISDYYSDNNTISDLDLVYSSKRFSQYDKYNRDMTIKKKYHIELVHSHMFPMINNVLSDSSIVNMIRNKEMNFNHIVNILGI